MEAPKGVVAYSYDSPAGPAVILAAPGGGGAAAISVDRSAFTHPGGAEPGVMHFLDGSSKRVSGDRAEIVLSQHGVAVWEL